MSDYFNGNDVSKIAGVQGFKSGESSVCCSSNVTIFPREVRYPFFTREVNETSFLKLVAKIGKNFSTFERAFSEFEKKHGIKFSEFESSGELIKRVNQLGKKVKSGEMPISIAREMGKIFGMWFGDDSPAINQRKRSYEEEIGKENFKQVQI